MGKDITLVVMAAGMGSRFGGLKQLEPIGKNGEVILDFSVYDAVKAGFNKVVFVIKHAIEDDFKRIVGSRIEKKVKVEYVFQETDALPEGFTCPADRQKPWGTAHAILCCKNVVKEPFAVVNADDITAEAHLRRYTTSCHRPQRIIAWSASDSRIRLPKTVPFQEAFVLQIIKP